MKLYSEEQVRKAIELSLLNAKLFIHKGLGDDKYFPTLYEALKNLTPIELPSDEEIEQEAYYKVSDPTENPYASFKSGAKWIKEQILNQNK
jgi:deoxycytidine triphosphate deaminase